MTRALVVTGTDTGIGKTVVAAGLAACLGASYWKPVQAGLDGETDSEAVRRLGGLDASRVLAEAYRLRTPASPHHAAALDGVTINPDRLAIPRRTDALVIEGAGGLMVPLTDELTFLDLFARWQRPVVLCARTRLGTINHTLLSLHALRRHDVPVLGVVFVGEAAPESEAIIASLGAVSVLGRLAWLEPLTPAGLQAQVRPISTRITQAMGA
ncbi:dethiobiotin synthase [Ancylobacter lacus]|uniref:dethiobiotin synthase n=1 Tax=Ancylobacter lacus TaxID=2579970 RepID=UPI001BCB7E64|nr:dethiobiotin synthase [Ancylobacter lacus]